MRIALDVKFRLIIRDIFSKFKSGGLEFGKKLCQPTTSWVSPGTMLKVLPKNKVRRNCGHNKHQRFAVTARGVNDTDEVCKRILQMQKNEIKIGCVASARRAHGFK
jgi:ketosteroid isomerase-like protein